MLDRASFAPLYHQITEQLRQEARSFKPGAPFLSESEIVSRFGVSRFTASRALNHLVKDGVVHRIQGKGTFANGQDDLSLRDKRILMFVRQPLAEIVVSQDYMWANMVQGLVDGIGSTAQLLLCPIPPAADEEAFCAERISDPSVHGVVLLSWMGVRRLVRLAVNQRKPFVLLNVKHPDLKDHNNVLSADAEGARQAALHLIRQGHRDILYLGHVDKPGTREWVELSRQNGYTRALIESGIEPAPRLSVRCAFINDANRRILERILDTRPLPMTAIFAASDPVAIEVLAMLRQRGLRVPQDISVVGADNCAAAAHTSPPLTTVSKPHHEMGRTAAEMILKQLRDGFAMLGMRLLPAELIVRKSVGPPAVHAAQAFCAAACAGDRR